MNKRFFFIGRPIGNLDDITIHALKVLKNSEIILTESMRSLTTLLKHHQIEFKQENIYLYDEKKHFFDLKDVLLKHNYISYVSDGGMPIFMDPGNTLMKFAKEHFYHVQVIPGVSSLSIALVYAGINEPFYFAGFPPRENHLRPTYIKNLNHFNIIVLYETPYRNNKLLEELKQYLKDEWEIFICMDLTTPKEKILHLHKRDIHHIIGRIEKSPAVFIIKKTTSKN